MKNGSTKSNLLSSSLFLAGLLVILILVPEVARAQSGPALAPYPFKAGMVQPLTKVTFTSNVEGAMLYVDGVYRGVLPLPYDLQLSVGEHSILIAAKGHYSLKSKIKVPAVVHKRYRVLLDIIYPEVPVVREKTSSNAWVAVLAVGVALTIGLVIGGVVYAIDEFFSGFMF